MMIHFRNHGSPRIIALSAGSTHSCVLIVVEGFLIVPLFRGSSRFESLILSHHSRFNVTCECGKEETNDDDDSCVWGQQVRVYRCRSKMGHIRKSVQVRLCPRLSGQRRSLEQSERPPIHRESRPLLLPTRPPYPLQGYLAHKKLPPP